MLAELSSNLPAQIGPILFGYGLGSVPFGVLVARAKGIDIRKVGSGNIGATNVKRALGTKWGLFVFFLDVLKGLLPSFLAWSLVGTALPMVLGSYSLLPREYVALAGFAAILGHCASPFLGFKGGKGIATGLGAVLGADPAVALSAFGAFIVVVSVTRYISLGSLVAGVAVFAFGMLFRSPPILMGAYVFLWAFVWYRHRDNVARLRAGTESKFSFRSEAKPSTDLAEERGNQT
ncbi:MAG: glycerol-3-phosphate 1-O-acyltransferase PlsY [Fimbriimonadaceae bacterium]|nr:glycerol-3-phosphate 1-O-acyltransferase PlsY [Fimbriimonadaceae bacterium]